MSKDYWLEAVSIALNDARIIATPEQIECVAGDMEVCHENYGMAMGHDAIPSHAETEKDREIARLKTQINELEGDIQIFRSSVARRRNVDISQVYLDRSWEYGVGHVMVEAK